MKQVSIFVMAVAIAMIVIFGIVFFHPVTDNVVDSNGFWAYMYGTFSVPWLVYSGAVIFLMGLTCFFATGKQQSRRYS
jgi:chromate transport protein ChrA